MKKISLLGLIVLLTACKGQNKLCECINEGNNLNKLSARMTNEVAGKMAAIKHNYFRLYQAQNDSVVQPSIVDSLKNVIKQDSLFVYSKKDSIQTAKKLLNKDCKEFEKLSDKEIQEQAKQCSSLKIAPK